jgi:hypothetical protein
MKEPLTLEEREITDAISRLDAAPDVRCAAHPSLAGGVKLSLRIGELTLYRVDEIRDTLRDLKTSVDAMNRGNGTTACGWTDKAKTLTGVMGVGAVVILAVLATLWKFKGWL